MASELKVSTRLTMGFGSVLVLMAIIGIVGIWNVVKLRDSLNDIVDDKFAKTVWANHVIDSVNAISVAMRELLVMKEEADRAIEFETIDQALDAATGNIERLQAAITTAAGVER